MCVLERNTRNVTVRMSVSRWNRILELEQAYRLAQAIKRSRKQVETAPSMSPEEAIEALRAL